MSKTEIKGVIRQRRKMAKWEEEHKERWVNRSEKVGEMRCAGRREETVISRPRFGHTGLNSTLLTCRCDHCGQEKKIEHVVIHCEKYEEEGSHMIEKF